MGNVPAPRFSSLILSFLFLSLSRPSLSLSVHLFLLPCLSPLFLSIAVVYSSLISQLLPFRPSPFMHFSSFSSVSVCPSPSLSPSFLACSCPSLFSLFSSIPLSSLLHSFCPLAFPPSFYSTPPSLPLLIPPPTLSAPPLFLSLPTSLSLPPSLSLLPRSFYPTPSLSPSFLSPSPPSVPPPSPCLSPQG